MLLEHYLIAYWVLLELWSVFSLVRFIFILFESCDCPIFSVLETKPASRNSSGTLGKVLVYAMCSGETPPV